MESEDPERLADELEQGADDMERRRDELQSNVRETRQDWERKRADPNVPGAIAPEPDEELESEKADQDSEREHGEHDGGEDDSQSGYTEREDEES